MTVAASATSVPPGGMILFRVSASAARSEPAEVATTVLPSATTPAFSPPLFTFAGCTCRPAGTSFALTLPAGPPADPQIEAQVSVPTAAPAGETIRFSATVSVASGSGSALTATGSAPPVTVAQAPASPSPAARSKAAAVPAAGPSSSGPASRGPASRGPAASAPGGQGTGSALGAVPAGAAGAALAGGTGPVAVPIGALPVIGSGAAGKTINVPAGSAANLFPQISPSPVSSQAPKTGPGARPGQNAVAADTTSPISLSGAQFGSQVIGLVVLLLGIAVVATGISVRKVQSAGNSGAIGAGTG